jgi:ABC-type phosphate/phosphonate transport system substrate-binding protein
VTWKCKGTRSDGTPAEAGEHDVKDVYGEMCPLCDLTEADVKGFTGGGSGSKFKPWMVAVPLTLLGLAGAGYAIQKNMAGSPPIATKDPGKPGGSTGTTGTTGTNSQACPFNNCTLKIGLVRRRRANSGSGGSSSGDAAKQPACEDAKLAQAQSAATGATPSDPNASRFDREPLRQYLEIELKKQYPSVKVEIDESIDPTQKDWVAAVDNKLKNKEWDIAFTSPLTAVTAKAQGYEFAFSPDFMGQSSSDSSIFARKDSRIASLKDITADKVVALGNQNDLVGYYMPVYDLYGTKPTYKTGNRSSKIMEMVLCKQADVGAGRTQLVKDNPNLTILTSRSLKAGAVYLSPQLSVDTRKKIQDLFTQAPAEVQKKAGYSQGTEPTNAQYGEIVRIKERAAELIGKEGSGISSSTAGSGREIAGQIENVRRISGQEYSMAVKSNNESFQVFVPNSILEKLDSNPVLNLPKKLAKLHNVKPDDKNKLQVTEETQITVE